MDWNPVHGEVQKPEEEKPVVSETPTQQETTLDQVPVQETVEETTEPTTEEPAVPVEEEEVLDRHVQLARESNAIKPDSMSQEAWDNRYKRDIIGRNFPELVQGLENFLHGGSAIGLGVVDTAADTAGFVGDKLNIPFLERIDELWDEHNPRSKDPLHTLVRDVSAIVIPAYYTNKVVVGGLGKATAARDIPKITRTLSAFLARAGIEVGIAGVSSQSYEQDNAAGALYKMFGWNPFGLATKDEMSPDQRRRLHMAEAASFEALGELIAFTASFAKKIKRFNQSEQALNMMNEKSEYLKRVLDEEQTNVVSESIDGLRASRDAAKKDEAIDRLIKNGDNAEYDPFINEPARIEQRVTSPETVFYPDPVGAKTDLYRIQNNLGSVDGIMRPAAGKPIMDAVTEATNATARAKAVGEFYETAIEANADVVISNRNIDSTELNTAVTKLTEQLFNPEISYKQFKKIIQGGKTMAYQGRKFLSEEKWVEASYAWKNAHDLIFNPKNLEASAMLSQQAADTITTTARALNLLDNIGTNSRQWEIMSEKMKLLVGEVTTTQDIIARGNHLKKLIEKGNFQNVAEWLNLQADSFDSGIAISKRKAFGVIDEIERIAKENPEYIRPLAEAYDATNGDINTLYKLHQFTEAHISLFKKALYDANPELPSFIIRGLHAIRYNSILNGLAPLRALVGNSVMSTIKPISVFTGAIASGEPATFKRAMYTYGGLIENFKRGFKMMGSDWRLANSNPEIAAKRGRLTQKYIDDVDRFQAMETMAEVWAQEGKTGKVAMWNMAKGLTHWNNWKYNRWGINALYSVDGFFKSLMASGSARAKAYDSLLASTNGSFTGQQFKDLQKHLYDTAFDSKNILRDRAADFAHKELALNIDYGVVDRFESYLNHMPAAKSLFMFPRTGINAFELSWSFNPLSNLGPAITRARRTLQANNPSEIAEILAEHGLDNTPEAFKALQSEYIGRQIMGTTVVMGAGMWAMEGNLTGNGPQDGAERKRMLQMGWKPRSIRNPITGQWHSYRGLEPIESILALTGDMVYHADRVDQSISEDWFRKLVSAVTLNLTNATFTAGFEPLVSLYSGDESAWNRFWAQWVDTTIPQRGVRSILNNIISPQLKDVENEFLQQLANFNKWMIPGNGKPLVDMLDVYTGEPIKFFEPMTAAACSLLPVFKCNGGMEPWRQWLLSTGWDGLGDARVDVITQDRLTPHAKQYINNWIGKNGGLRSRIIEIMNMTDDEWATEIRKYKKNLKGSVQKDFPIKKTLLFRLLDQAHTEAFSLANVEYHNWLKQNDPTALQKGILRRQIKATLSEGDIDKAGELKDQLLQYK